jgi:uncharacterized membrane protein
MEYRWWVFLHIAGVFGFLIAHGVSVGVAFRLRREREPKRIMALLDLSNSSITLLYWSLLLLIGGGVVAGFVGDWWGDGWIWVSLGTLLLTIGAMYAVATTYYRRLRTVIGAMADGSQAISEERLGEVLAGPRAWVLAAIGFGAILFILYLMLFKPF